MQVVCDREKDVGSCRAYQRRWYDQMIGLPPLAVSVGCATFIV